MESRKMFKDKCDMDVVFEQLEGEQGRGIIIMIKAKGEHETPLIAELSVPQKIALKEWL